MNIWERLDRDHTVIHASATDILQNQSDHPRLQNQFAIFDHEVRRHLGVVEDVIFPLLKENEETARLLPDLQAEHKALRKELGKLDRPDKTGTEWPADFQTFVNRFEALCSRHDGLENLSSDTIDEQRALELGEEYEQAKMQRLEGSSVHWNKVGIGVGAAVGVAAVGAALFGAARARKRDAGSDEFRLRLQTDETVRLISSKKVEGTAVLSRDGGKLGTIDSFMVDKYTGRVAYAVLSFGGAFGLGTSLFPLPWASLDYEEEMGGYVLDISAEDLANAPRFEASDEPEFDVAYRRSIILFYEPGGAERGDEQTESTQRTSEPAG